MKKLICFGDSIFERELSDNGTRRLTSRILGALGGWEVMNAGIRGNNTRDALVRLDDDVLKHSPDVVAILLGANDAAAHKMISLEEYESNLCTIVQRIGHLKTILITPSPVDEDRPNNRSNEILKKYAEAVRRVASSSGSQCIDLFAEMIQKTGYAQMLSDGLHFEDSGYELLSRLIKEKIKEFYL